MEAESGLVPGRLARGSRCFGAWVGHELVGYGWLSTKSEWIGEMEREIGLPPGEAYIWNCVTIARHRRKGVFRSVVNSIVGQSTKEGLTRLWIASVVGIGGKTIQQAGFEPVLQFDSGKMLGMHWLRARPAPGVNAGLLGSARQALGVRGPIAVRRSVTRKH
ncbi:MAG TPA: GNAT family N-acetyltransferase [Candidatus Dormibacteraeota bacterium]|nr:GNAT family N-acetyltransferase [Candidatus Dormibacteraeota bacterium]